MSHLYRFGALLPAAGAPVIKDAGLLEHEGRILAVGPFAEIAPQAPALTPEEINGLALPGLIDAHSHVRGMPLSAHGIPLAPLEAWICSLAAMTPLQPRDEAFVAASDLIGTGVTSVQGIVHDFGSPDDVIDSAISVVDGVWASGIRALVVVGFTDRAERTPVPTDASLNLVPPVMHGTVPTEWARIVHRISDRISKTEMVRLGVGPVAPQWCSDHALESIAALRGELRLHAHLNESALQRKWVAGEPDSLERLRACRLIGSFCSVAHGVHLDRSEIAALAGAGATIVHCPSSNERLSVGSADVVGWLAAGVGVALGLDSQGEGQPDMFHEMRAAQFAAAGNGAALTAAEVLAMATEGGARALGVPAGRLAPGLLADMCVLDLHVSPHDDVAAKVVAEGSRERVSDVVVGGSRTVRRGRLLRRRDVEIARKRLQAELDHDRADRSARLRALDPAIRQLTAFGKAHA